MFLGGLVGAETCCQTVQKVGEVRLESFWPEIVEAVCGGQVRVQRKRRFQGVSEPSFCVEIHVSAGCSFWEEKGLPRTAVARRWASEMFLRASPLKTFPNYGPFAKITTLAPDNYNRHTHPPEPPPHPKAPQGSGAADDSPSLTTAPLLGSLCFIRVQTVDPS